MFIIYQVLDQVSLNIMKLCLLCFHRGWLQSLWILSKPCEEGTISILICMWRNWGPERLSNMPKVMLVEHMDLGLELSSLSPWVQPLSSYYAEYVWHVNDCPLARSTKWLSKKMNSNHQKKARAIFVMEPGFGLRCVSLQRLAPTSCAMLLGGMCARMQVWELQQKLEWAWKSKLAVYFSHITVQGCVVVVDTGLLSSQHTATLKTQLPSYV